MQLRLAMGLFLCVPVAFTQSTPAFEVASVKPSAITAGSWVRFLPGGRLSAASWLKQLIQIAYGVEDYQVSGGPSWLTSQWYEIEAKAANASADRSEMTAMLRSLIEERFKLQLRREEKAFPVFVLKADKGGPRLTPLKDGEKSRCTRDNSFVCGLKTTSQLAKSLQYIVGRPVLDQTGAAGTFDILLDFDVYATRGGTPPPDYEKPSLTAALREQLGLRLDASQERLPWLVVEKVERRAKTERYRSRTFDVRSAIRVVACLRLRHHRPNVGALWRNASRCRRTRNRRMLDLGRKSGTQREKPPLPERLVWRDAEWRLYLLMRYVLSPPSGLKDSTAKPAFFIAPAMNPRTV